MDLRKWKREEIKSQTERILKSTLKNEEVSQLLGLLESEKEPWLISAGLNGITKVVDHYVRSGYIPEKLTHTQEKEEDEEDDPQNSSQDLDYLKWVRGVYDEALKRVLDLMSYSGKKKASAIREMALVTVMKWLVTFHEKNTMGENHWLGSDVHRLRTVMSRLLCKTDRKLISRFQEYMEYLDVREHAIIGLLKLMKGSSEHRTPLFQENFLTFLEILNFNNSSEGPTLICHNTSGDSIYNYEYDRVRKAFSALWEDFLKKTKLTPEMYKRVLLIISDKVMPYLTRPLILTDFLVNSYNIGGSISLLSLNGVFTLIQKYNLEYPDFYEKLYALFTPEVLHAKYKARFFYLADLFLTSTHLPEYLVAAFAKRLSRIALKAPTNSLLLVFPFVGNLIIRHKGLLKMIHNDKAVDEDPYIFEERDPFKCRAIESSLWEIETLMCHAMPQVAQSAKFITKNLPEMEWDSSEYFEMTMKDIMEKETKKKIFVNVPLTFERPEGFKFQKTERLSNFFITG